MSDQNVNSNRLSLIPAELFARSTSAAEDSQPSEDTDGPTLDAVLNALDDDTCRVLLAALDEPKSAAELGEECNVSSSTVYRKLTVLRESLLVREYTEVRRDGPNATLYERDFTDVSISVTDDEFSLSVSRPEHDTEDRMATFWSAMREEPQ